MKIHDPQSALLTTSEVHQFLAAKPPRPPPRKIGSYKTVDLKGYQRIRQDFQHYVKTTVPYIEKYPPPETFVKAVVPKLRPFGLTKTEVLMLINLGVGLPRNQYSQSATNKGDDDTGDQPEEAQEEPDDRQLLSLVVEELEDRFPGEQGEVKIEKILQTMRIEYDRASTTHAATNGNAKTVVKGEPE